MSLFDEINKLTEQRKGDEEREKQRQINHINNEWNKIHQTSHIIIPLLNEAVEILRRKGFNFTSLEEKVFIEYTRDEQREYSVQNEMGSTTHFSTETVTGIATREYVTGVTDNTTCPDYYFCKLQAEEYAEKQTVVEEKKYFFSAPTRRVINSRELVRLIHIDITVSLSGKTKYTEGYASNYPIDTNHFKQWLATKLLGV